MAMKRVELDLGKYEPKLVSPGVGVWQYEKLLPLTTDGHLRLIALGVGAGFSNKMRQSNFIIVKGQTALFVDLGAKATMRLAEFGRSVHDIEHILITHSHADHTGSLEELALKKRYEAPFLKLPKQPGESDAEYMKRIVRAQNRGQFRPALYIGDEYVHELWEDVLRGGLMVTEKTNIGLADFFKIKKPREITRKNPDGWEYWNVGNIRVASLFNKHAPEGNIRSHFHYPYTVGLVIDGRIFISGDTRFDQSLINQFGQNCEMLLHDCQHYPGGVHANFNELKTLPAEIRRRMYLYHLSDGMLNIDVKADGFASRLEAAPIVYDFDPITNSNEA